MLSQRGILKQKHDWLVNFTISDYEVSQYMATSITQLLDPKGSKGEPLLCKNWHVVYSDPKTVSVEVAR